MTTNQKNNNEVNRSGFYLFDLFEIDYLVRNTTYSEIYLKDIKRGNQPARKKFKQVVANELKRSEEELFSITEVRNGD
jgi:hypothetical protein